MLNKKVKKYEKMLLFLVLSIGVLSANAREPYGDYISRYIVTFDSRTNAKSYHPIYNPIKITYSGIRVSNTNQGVKTTPYNRLLFTLTHSPSI